MLQFDTVINDSIGVMLYSLIIASGEKMFQKNLIGEKYLWRFCVYRVMFEEWNYDGLQFYGFIFMYLLWNVWALKVEFVKI